MARPRKSAKILEAKGAFKKDPGRKRTDLQGVGEAGDPPEEFSDLEKALWNRLKELAPPGVITGSDELLLEVGARAWAKMRQTPIEEVRPSLVAQMINICNALCISPQGRTKIVPPHPKKKNAFEGF